MIDNLLPLIAGCVLCSFGGAFVIYKIMWAITKNNRTECFNILANRLLQLEQNDPYLRSERMHREYGMPRLFPNPERGA